MEAYLSHWDFELINPFVFSPLFFIQGELTSCILFLFLLKWALLFLVVGSSFSSLFPYLLLPFSVTHKLYLHALL
jgi:hypothetical protein